MENDQGNGSLDSASQELQTLLPDFYDKWATSLMTKAQYAEAIQHYEDAKNILSAENSAAVDEGIANTEIKWAANMEETGDFLSALSKIKSFRQNTVNKTVNQELEAEYQSILKAFSISTGAQAHTVIF